MPKETQQNPFQVDGKLLGQLIMSGPATCYYITIKSGLRYKYFADSEEDAINMFIKEERETDERHANRNNYDVRELDYKGMILSIESK